MEVYLIRHGETGGNVAHRHQAEDSPLTKRGEEQAAVVAAEIKELKPTHLVSSPLVRALETARIIGDECDLVAATNSDFIELVRPNHLYGNYHTSLVSMWFYLYWFLGKSSDGESYDTVRARIESAKSYFAQFPEDARVVVVSHSVFINLFLAHLCDDKPMSFKTAVQTFIAILRMKNTHLTPLIYDPEAHADTCGWWRVEE